MKAQPLKHEVKDGSNCYIFCDAAEATHVQFRLPGPISNIRLPVLVGMSKTRAGTNCWSWNGDVEKPTIRPSVLHDFRPNDPLVNHIWITDGQVQFLGDCSHEFAGQTLDLISLSNVRDERPPLASGEAPAREADQQEACQKSRRDGGSLDRIVGIISLDGGAK